jgi:hypothetical protein
MWARQVTAMLTSAAAMLSACGGRLEEPSPESATPVVEGAVSIVWDVVSSDVDDSDIQYQVAVVFRLRNPATAAMPEANYRVRLTDSQGATVAESLPQHTALAPGESRYVVYTRDDVSAAGNPADREQVAQRAPEAATVTTGPSALEPTAIPPSALWRPHQVRASCDAGDICSVTGEIEWTGDQPAAAPQIAVVAFEGGRLVAGGLASGSGAQLRPHQREEFEVVVTVPSRKLPKSFEIVPHLLPD